MNSVITRSEEISCEGFFCGADACIEINGLRLRPDATKAYVEFYVSHSLPVITTAGTALHPQVVANSYHTMLHQVFDLNHIIKSYNPDQNARDRVLGNIVAVEFPPTPMGGWTVQADKNKAPAIRAVATIGKQLEGADRIIGQHKSGRRTWTVSMENSYYLEESGFLVRGQSGLTHHTTPDLAKLGYEYILWLDAPKELKACFDPAKSESIKRWRGMEVVFLIGGMGGSVHYDGVGITPMGKEREAEIVTMLASDAPVEVTPEQALEASLVVLKKLAEIQ
jgi:hypothetical protein